MTGECVGDGFLEVIEYPSALLYSYHNRTEVIIQEDHISGILSHICTCNTHRNSNISLLDSWRVIDTVAGDCYNLPCFLASLNDDKFLGWTGSCEYYLWFGEPGSQFLSLL